MTNPDILIVEDEKKLPGSFVIIWKKQAMLFPSWNAEIRSFRVSEENRQI